jgi:hypothetical protein
MAGRSGREEGVGGARVAVREGLVQAHGRAGRYEKLGSLVKTYLLARKRRINRKSAFVISQCRSRDRCEIAAIKGGGVHPLRSGLSDMRSSVLGIDRRCIITAMKITRRRPLSQGF